VFSIVLSVFAVVILSTIGALFKVRLSGAVWRKHISVLPHMARRGARRTIMLILLQGNSHEVMGGKDDPEDGAAVAGAVFGAVFIYIVCLAWEQTAFRMTPLMYTRASLCSAASRPSCTTARAAVARSACHEERQSEDAS
jgi:hypothetical protein